MSDSDYYYNDFLDIYGDNNFGDSFPQNIFGQENLLSEKFDEETKNINNEDNNNNNASFKIKILIEESNEKSTNEETEKKEKEKEKEKQIIHVPKFKITNTNEPKEDLIQKLNKKRGRKKRLDSKITHNKYSDDNLRRKCKHLVLQNVMKFINDKIEEIYGDKGYGMTMKKLLIINQKQISNATIKFNKIFLNRKLSEIFSVNISTRYTNFRQDHNKNLILKLINDKDEIKSNYFKILFNLTFVECLRHFNESVNIPILNGMTILSKLNLDDKSDKNYSEVLNLSFFHIIVYLFD